MLVGTEWDLASRAPEAIAKAIAAVVKPIPVANLKKATEKAMEAYKAQGATDVAAKSADMTKKVLEAALSVGFRRADDHGRLARGSILRPGIARSAGFRLPTARDRRDEVRIRARLPEPALSAAPQPGPPASALFARRGGGGAGSNGGHKISGAKRLPWFGRVRMPVPGTRPRPNPPPSAQNFQKSPKPSYVENLSRGDPKIQSNNPTFHVHLHPYTLNDIWPVYSLHVIS